MVSFLFCDYNIISFKYSMPHYYIGKVPYSFHSFSQGVVLHWCLMLKIPSYYAVKSFVSLGALTATWIWVAWALQPTIRPFSHHQHKWCLSSVLGECSHVDFVWTSCRGSKTVTLTILFFLLLPISPWKEEEAVRRGMGDGFYLISPPCSGNRASFLSQSGYLFVSSVDVRIKAALGINDFGLRLH